MFHKEERIAGTGTEERVLLFEKRALTTYWMPG